MKIITLHQPWASFIKEGFKTYETRSWATKYRGPLLIHAGKKKFKKSQYDSVMESYSEFFSVMGIDDLNELPYGKILCITNLTEVVKTEVAYGHISMSNIKLGDWSPNRYGWKLDDVCPLIDPIQHSGQQGIRDYKTDLHEDDFIDRYTFGFYKHHQYKYRLENV